MAVRYGDAAGLSALHPPATEATAIAQLGEEIVFGPEDVIYQDHPSRLIVSKDRLLVVGDSDVAIDGSCIDLHGLSKKQVYIQLHTDDLVEMAFHVETDELAERLFAAITILIQNNPDDNDDETSDNDGWFTGQDQGATPQERQAMLDHLDSILVEPNNNAENDQFQDADVGDNDDNNIL